MRNHSQRLFLVCLLVVASSWSATAKSAEPSKAETIRWLTQKLTGYSVSYNTRLADLRDSFVNKINTISFDNGVLEVRTQLDAGGTIYKQQMHRVKLSDLTTRTEVGEIQDAPVVFTPVLYFVDLTSTRGQGVTIETKGARQPISHGKSVRLMFAERELAERVEKAFKRLIELSGGESEPY